MSFEELARLAEGLATLLWPLLAVLIVAALLPVLREIVRQRQFTIKVGSFELSAQQAADQLGRHIEDLQGKVAEIDQRTSSAPQAGPASPKPTQQPRPARKLTILWIDDHPESNAIEIARLQSEGHHIVTAKSSDEATRLLHRQHFDLVLSDIARSISGREGIDFMKEMQAAGDAPPIGFYTPTKALERHGDALSDAFVATDSFVELMSAIRKHAKGTDADKLHS